MSGDKVDRFAAGRAEDSAVDDLLADPGDARRKRTFDCGVMTNAMDHVLHGVLIRGLQLVDPNMLAVGFAFRLDADRRLVIVAANRAVSAFEDEATFGLGLVLPGIGKRAPSR